MSDTLSRPSFAGGEVSEEMQELHRKVGASLLSDPGIHRIQGLYHREDGSWIYMAQTTYATFPKFVIGQTNAELTEARILVLCGEEWNAQAKWIEHLTHSKS